MNAKRMTENLVNFIKFTVMAMGALLLPAGFYGVLYGLQLFCHRALAWLGY